MIKELQLKKQQKNHLLRQSVYRFVSNDEIWALVMVYLKNRKALYFFLRWENL